MEATTTTTTVAPKTITTTTTTTVPVTTTTTTERTLYLYEFVDQFSLAAGMKSFYEKQFNKPKGVKKTFSEWSTLTKLSK